MAQGDFHFYRINIRTPYNDTQVPTPASRKPSFYATIRIEESGTVAPDNLTDTEQKRLDICKDLANRLIGYLQSQGDEVCNLGITRVGIEKIFNSYTTPNPNGEFVNLSEWYNGVLPAPQLVGKPYPKRSVSYTNNLGNIVLTLDTLEPTNESPDILPAETDCIAIFGEITSMAAASYIELTAHDYKDREIGIIKTAQQNIYTATR